MSASKVRFLCKNQALCPHSPTHADTLKDSSYICWSYKIGLKINAYKTSISFSSSIKTNKKNCQFVFEKNVPINPCNDLCWKILLNPFPFSLNILRILLFSCLVLYDSMQPHGPGVACQDPLSIGLPRQEYWSGLPFPSQKDLPYPKIEPLSPELAGRFFTPEPQSLGRSSF